MGIKQKKFSFVNLSNIHSPHRHTIDHVYAYNPHPVAL